MEASPPGVILPCGWGRLIFAHTFVDPTKVAETLLNEEPGQRDIAYYIVDPHLVLNHAPQSLFLDPSNSYRLNFEDYQPSTRELNGFRIEAVQQRADLEEANRIYRTLNMVPVDVDYALEHRECDKLYYAVARSEADGSILGVVMGVDHAANFDDIENGSSLWSLAVDPQAEFPGIGEALVRHIVEYFRDRGREQLDLSVMHNNQNAIRLYEKLGFQKVAIFAVKCRNRINEKLFIGTPPHEGFNPYATILIDEALRRGIHVEPLDPKRGYFRLSLGGRVITCRESLSELTSAVAMSRCDDKELTRDLLEKHGVSVPAQRIAGSPSDNRAFLQEHGSVVVKPARGEQGRGVFVDVRTPEGVEKSIAAAREEDERVLLEQYVTGEDLRIIVIHYEVVAAAIRKPPEICGTGQHTIQSLIESLSRRRSAATGGESKIPLDGETERCVQEAGYDMDSTLPQGEKLRVRKTANLHTGGTIHDVTADLHPELAAAAVKAAQALEIPVVGLDFIVPDVTKPDYVVIEANERPGLANHEPQPTAQKFIDLLFPQTMGNAPPRPNGEA
ncbi:MAG: N-acetylglutaminylglutamine synthetase [Verrucomicrobiota bacterium JB022]|nr:N-acetylglutaminylglutamine synthetase [Verrucomicrobiota bacterium JB022]